MSIQNQLVALHCICILLHPIHRIHDLLKLSRSDFYIARRERRHKQRRTNSELARYLCQPPGSTSRQISSGLPFSLLYIYTPLDFLSIYTLIFILYINRTVRTHTPSFLWLISSRTPHIPHFRIINFRLLTMPSFDMGLKGAKMIISFFGAKFSSN